MKLFVPNKLLFCQIWVLSYISVIKWVYCLYIIMLIVDPALHRFFTEEVLS
jgi:hypothetical protein